jgi:uncharacterized repeat protein (TIGR01451 family)
MNRRSRAVALFVSAFALLSLLLPPTLAAAPAAPAGNSVIGNYVWLDANADGLFLGAESEFKAGINNVKVNLYHDKNLNGLIDPGEFVQSALTGDDLSTKNVTESGWYRFGVTAGGNQYIVEIDPSNFAVGGPLENKVHTSQTTIIPNPAVIYLADVVEDYFDADFGYVAAPLTVTKVLLDTNLYVQSGAAVKFRITVTNTGPQTLNPVPLEDFFSPACLKYVSATITPDVVDSVLGRLRWNNVGPLTPGQAVVIDVTYTAQTSNEMAWKEGGWQDYAPKGIPDFDQKQSGWDNPAGSGSGWYRAGPVAAANSLWWFDSKFEAGTTPPPTISDGYALIQTYSPTAAWDDHDPRNVPPLVDALATRMGTTAGAGTPPANLASGITQFIADAGLASSYMVATQKAPTFAWVGDEIRQSKDVILLIGFWQTPAVGGPARRLGGHYVTSSGVDLLNGKIAFSDPYRDNAEAGGAGRVLPGGHAALHPPAGPQTSHNDAQYISEDAYDSVATTAVPAGVWAPDAYVSSSPATGCGQVASFAGQNVPSEFAGDGGLCDLGGGPIITTVEYAIAVSPVMNTPMCSPTVNIAAATGVTVDTSKQVLPPAQAETPVTQGMDLGDLPDVAGPTLIVSNGARHLLTTPLRLGTIIDSELDGQPTSAVNGDDTNPSTAPDDEDGITYKPGKAGPWADGTVAAGKGGSIQIVISGGSGVPQLFMDFNPSVAPPLASVVLRDVNGTPLPTTPWAAGTYQIYFDIPSGTMGGNPTEIIARARISSAGGLTASGIALDGEVEDYLFKFTPTAVSIARFSADSTGTNWLVYALAALGLAGLVQLWRQRRSNASAARAGSE